MSPNPRNDAEEKGVQPNTLIWLVVVGSIIVVVLYLLVATPNS